MSKIALEPNASGTGVFSIASPNSNTNRTLTLPDETGTVLTSVSAIPAAQITGLTSTNPLTLGTAVASTSGTAIDFTGIPSWAKRVTVMLDGVSWAANPGRPRIRLGSAGGLETTGYSTAAVLISGASASASAFSDGVYLSNSISFDASSTFSGTAIFTNVTGNTWTVSGSVAVNGYNSGASSFGGVKALSDTLDRLRIEGSLGATFDAGTINISYEG